MSTPSPASLPSPVTPGTPPTLLSAFASQFSKDLSGFEAKRREAEERIVQLRTQIAELEKQLVALAGGRTYCEYCLSETKRLADEMAKAVLPLPASP